MPETVHLYVFDGWMDFEPAYALAGIRNPDFQREPGRYEVKTVAAGSRAALRSMGGVTVLPDLTLQELRPEHSAMFVLPGGPQWDDAQRHRAAEEAALAFVEAGVPVAAICGATAGLARRGVLDARPHTSNALAYLKGTGYDGGAAYVDAPAVRDAGLITAGGMAPIEFAREIFLELGVYDDETLEAWTQLYKTGKSEYYARMARAASGE